MFIIGTLPLWESECKNKNPWKLSVYDFKTIYLCYGTENKYLYLVFNKSSPQYFVL